MYTKVLVPLDGSPLAEQILPYARLMAEVYGIPLDLLWVTDPEARPPFSPPQEGGEYLQRLVARCFPSSLQVTYAEKIGEPAAVIVDTAAGDPGCLIAMATHGMSGIRRWLLGSVASKVVQKAQNPLLLIRPVEDGASNGSVELKTIFVPLDGSGLAEIVLPHVLALAKKLRAEVHLLRVYTLPANAYVVADGVIAQGAEQYREELQKAADVYLDSKLQTLRAEGLEKITTTSIAGDPALEIIDIARKTRNNLIAMSTHGRSGVGRWLLGSVAEKVIQHSGDPVLLVRPI
jgi:nucleotide-binding universal stress UspA family protein